MENQITAGDWTDPERTRTKLGDYARSWIEQRPGLRPRTTALYTWLLSKHIEPCLGEVELGKLTTAHVRKW